MSKFRFTVQLLALAMFTFAFTSLAQAQAARTWVSGLGDDDNPCNRTSPCKTFFGAYNKTAEGGEINALDQGGYGTLTISKAITIDGGTGGGYASVLAGTSHGILVNISSSAVHANDAVVILRNLSFNGLSQSPGLPGGNGIHYQEAAQLHVERCQFQNLGSNGIKVNLGTTSGNLTVTDSVFNNVNTVITSDATAPGLSVIQFEHNRMVGSSTGFNANTSTSATIRDCYFGSFLGPNGAVRAGTASQVNVFNSMFAFNNIAANVAGGTIRLSNNEFFNNATAVSGGAESANNNKLRGNTADGTFVNLVTVQ